MVYLIFRDLWQSNKFLHRGFIHRIVCYRAKHSLLVSAKLGAGPARISELRSAAQQGCAKLDFHGALLALTSTLSSGLEVTKLQVYKLKFKRGQKAGLNPKESII